MLNTEFEIIFVMLGDACNFKCTYCMQGDHKLCVTQPVLSDKFLNYLDKYKSRKKTQLCFWGGEPLLYFPVIKKIINRYGDKFQYGTVSNGSLLTEKIVDFFNQYNVRYCLSHDGEITERTRGIDILQDKEIKALYEKINNRFINVTYSSVSPPIEQIIKSYPEEQIININTIINTTDTVISRKYAEFDTEKYKQDIEYLLFSYEKYINGDKTKKREYHNVQRMINSLDIYLKEGRSVNRCFDCGKGAKMLNVDTSGNLYMCHNSHVHIGTVEDKWENIQINIDNILSLSRQKCKKCSFNKVCGGSCMILNGTGEAQRCKLSKMFYSIFIPWIIKMKKKN